jgi:WhiB family redox-sensing transcriptional regulator
VTTADGVVAPDYQWQLQANCVGQYPTYFFPPSERELPEERAEREALARAVCRECPVVQPCLDLAQALGEPDGIWGGMNERQRRKHRARRALNRSRTSSREA